ncbi:MAG TPA: hypothetical protein VFB50_23255 [Chloroflexota bacterium]|nr:hypothetical protein [Chloroflexota bacterium]
MTPWLSVVIPTIGRDTLVVTLESLRVQPESAGVEVLVVADTHGAVNAQLGYSKTHVEAEGHCWLEHDGGRHCVGQPQRTFGAKQATAPWVWFSQDDNIAAQDSLAAIELAIDSQSHARPLFFRMQTYWGETIWHEQRLRQANIDADCLVFPREIAHQVEWGLRYEGDLDAAIRAFNLSGGDVGWINEVISVGRPSAEQLWWR